MSVVNRFDVNREQVLLDTGIYDVSAHNNGVVFESLSALLNHADLSTLIPTQVRCGGMSIRFIQASDNKYAQYRLMSDSFNTTVTNWQGVDSEPMADSRNLAESNGVKVGLDNISQNWEFAKYDMAGNYTETSVKTKINIKKGYKYKIEVSETSSNTIWLSLRDNGNTKNLIQIVLPANTEGEFTADDDYPNAFLTANCLSNNSKVVGSIVGDNSINIIDSLESNNESDALSAKQGNVLFSKIFPYMLCIKGKVQVVITDYIFKAIITEAVNVRYKYRDTIKVKEIELNSEYSISPNYALVINATDNTVSTVARDSIQSYHIVLVGTGEYESGWEYSLFGLLIGKHQTYTDSQKKIERKTIDAQLYMGNVIKSYYGSGFINDFQYVSGKVKVSFAEAAIIYCFLNDGTYNSASISANSEYLLSQHQALVFDTSKSVADDKIKVKDVSAITFEDFILIQVAYIDGNYKRYITGYYSNRLLIATQYENYNLHNVKQQYERDVDDKSLEVLNENVDFSILIATDLHTNTQGVVQSTPELNVLMRIDKNINPDIVVNLGDTVGLGLESPNRAYYSLNDIKQSTDYIKDYYYVVGNHDYNNLSSVSVDRQPKTSIIPHKAIYNVLGKLHEDDVVWGSKEGMYYYKDFSNKKIRVIFLNTLDKPEEWVTIDGTEYEKYPWLPNIVSSDQIDWLIDTALNFTSKGEDKINWSVIICSHVTPAPNVLGNSASLGALDISNPQGVEICKIAEAFASGTSKVLSYVDSLYGGNATLNRNADFTAQGAMKLIGWFSGHNHRDTKQTINGVTYLTTLCGYYSSGVDENYITMTPDTYTEFALDLLIVDKVNRTAKLKRYGAGSDREWNY